MTEPTPWPATDAEIAETMLPAGLDALATVEALIDTPPLTQPQAQGDVMVMPWPASTIPAYRGQEADAATPVPDAGIPVTADGSHVLIPENLGRDHPVCWHPNPKGYTLGTLVVPVGAAARLSHHEHADLLIGYGVYVIQQQRRWSPTGPVAGD